MRLSQLLHRREEAPCGNPASVVISTPKDDIAALNSAAAAASGKRRSSFAGGLVRALSRSPLGGAGPLAESCETSPKSVQTDEERVAALSASAFAAIRDDDSSHGSHGGSGRSSLRRLPSRVSDDPALPFAVAAAAAEAPSLGADAAAASERACRRATTTESPASAAAAAAAAAPEGAAGASGEKTGCSQRILPSPAQERWGALSRSLHSHKIVIRDTSAHGASNFSGGLGLGLGGAGGGSAAPEQQLPAAAAAFAAVAREALAAASASADEGRRQPTVAAGLAPRTPSGAFSLGGGGGDDDGDWEEDGTVVGEIHFSGGSARLLSRVASRGGLAAVVAAPPAQPAA